MSFVWRAVLLGTLFISGACSLGPRVPSMLPNGRQPAGGAASEPAQAGTAIPPPSQDPHDPDGLRGPLPSPETRKDELRIARRMLDRMYAHRLDKLRRYGIDEDALFREAEERLQRARSWYAYDGVLYRTFAAFHDAHLVYRPPAAAAPGRGYHSFSLGLETVLAGDRLLVASVEPGGDPAAAGVAPGDEVTAVDGTDVAELLRRAVALTCWSRERSAESGWVRTWTNVLAPPGEEPRTRRVEIRARGGGPTRVVVVHLREVPRRRRPPVGIERSGEIGVITLRTFGGGRVVAREITEALAEARATARGLVLDLRGNRGGLDSVGYTVLAGLVAGRARVGSYRVLLAPETLARRPAWRELAQPVDPSGFSRPDEIDVNGLPAGEGFHGPIAVVVDAGCASTCEVVAAALRADLGARLFGETTAGTSGAPVAVGLPASRGELSIPTWALIDAEGRAIEGEGVVPDVEVEATPEALAEGEDLPLEAAMSHVRARLAARTSPGAPSSNPASRPR